MTARIRPGLISVVAFLLAGALLVTAACEPDDSGPGSYNPSPGNHIWYPKRK